MSNQKAVISRLDVYTNEIELLYLLCITIVNYFILCHSFCRHQAPLYYFFHCFF